MLIMFDTFAIFCHCLGGTDVSVATCCSKSTLILGGMAVKFDVGPRRLLVFCVGFTLELHG